MKVLKQFSDCYKSIPQNAFFLFYLISLRRKGGKNGV